jgi:hypothetical protein
MPAKWPAHVVLLDVIILKAQLDGAWLGSFDVITDVIDNRIQVHHVFGLAR